MTLGSIQSNKDKEKEKDIKNAQTNNQENLLGQIDEDCSDDEKTNKNFKGIKSDQFDAI